jgi:hypothetical protein
LRVSADALVADALLAVRVPALVLAPSEFAPTVPLPHCLAAVAVRYGGDDDSAD